MALLLSVWLLPLAARLQANARAPVDTFLVLGGSIRRELYVAEQAKAYPEARVLISNGSPDPCVWLIFQRDRTPMDNVWLEHCAHNTFDNFYFCTPILTTWQSRHIRLITSETHLPRALWLAQIHLGARGIWVEPDIASESGIPGNWETWWKTALDVTRSLVWAAVAPLFPPQCDDVIALADVDIQAWRQQGFKCEHQAGLEDVRHHPD
ncbi:MAG: YdcF family protein [Spirulinaceae cyanobacterium RM2_2_10]|nr:YdcF family protein [Spirulinaceae cyanobacterium SM2_1_0]NJO20375.1 YdcF family protein [Spirulinaceae cyanobacterium RM2_2_10]